MILQAKTFHLIEALNIYKSCIPGMNKNGLYNWNTAYPDASEVESDIVKGELFLYQHYFTSIGVVCLNTVEPEGYNEIEWKYQGPSLIVHRMAVHPVWRNMKIAEKLMVFAYEYAKKKHFNSIRLDAITRNPSALRLYEKCGYESAGNLHFEYQKDPFRCMELKII